MVAVCIVAGAIVLFMKLCFINGMSGIFGRTNNGSAWQWMSGGSPENEESSRPAWYRLEFLGRASGRNASRRRRRRRRRCESNATRERKQAKIQTLTVDKALSQLAGTRASQQYAYACEYVASHGVDERSSRFTDQELEAITEYGALAWEFEPGLENHGIDVCNGSDISFTAGEQSLLTALHFPSDQRVCYFEIRLDQLPPGTNVAVGVAMKSYPPLRMAGWARNSVAYHSLDGSVYYSHPLDTCGQAGSAKESDTLGVGWRPRSGKIFFAINGAIICHARTPWAQRKVYPVVSADGPCRISINAGMRAFVLAQANMRGWELGSPEGERAPPPAYHNPSDTVLLDTGIEHRHRLPRYSEYHQGETPDYRAIDVETETDNTDIEGDSDDNIPATIPRTLSTPSLVPDHRSSLSINNRRSLESAAPMSPL